MKAISICVLSGFAFLVIGCGSIINSTREGKFPPPPDKAVSGTPYYLPKGKIIVAGSWNKDARLWDIKISPVIEADPAARYFAYRHVNALFDDDITLAVDPTTGLLQTANATSTDQTVNALAGLISAAASALTFGAGLGPLPTGGGTANEKEKEFNEIKANAFFSAFQVVLNIQGMGKEAFVVSPDADASKVLYAKFKVQLSPLDYNPLNEAPTDTETNFSGILVRRVIPFSVKLQANVYTADGKTSSTFEAPAQTVMLPDEKRNYTVSLTRTPLVSNSTKVSLINGIVQSQQNVRPSIVMGIVGVPKTLLGALAPIPLQVRTDQQNLMVTEDKTLTAQQHIQELKKDK